MMAMSKLRAWRERRKLTLKAAAEMFQISVAYLSMIETGSRTPSRKMALLIQEKTGGRVRPADY
jgi:transcriptional regulator with XRE-family HTH domain